MWLTVPNVEKARDRGGEGIHQATQRSKRGVETLCKEVTGVFSERGPHCCKVGVLF